MKVQFTDGALTESFNRDGYVVLDLLAADELNTLRRLAAKHIPENFTGIFTNVHLLSPEANKEIGDLIVLLIGASACTERNDQSAYLVDRVDASRYQRLAPAASSIVHLAYL